MTAREMIGYVLAAMILLWHIVASDMAQRLDWVTFGTNYRQQQTEIIAAVNRLATDMQVLKQEAARQKSVGAEETPK